MNIPEPVLEAIQVTIILLIVGRLFSLAVTGIGVIAIMIFGAPRPGASA